MATRRWRGLALARAALSVSVGVVAIALLALVLQTDVALVRSAGAGDNLQVASEPVTYTIFLPQVWRDYARPLPSLFGVQMYGSISEDRTRVSAAPPGGVYWVRWSVPWAAAYPPDYDPEGGEPPVYRWEAYDQSLQSLYGHGLRVIGTIRSNPSWAAIYPEGPISPTQLSEFVAFVGALVERYDGDGYDDAPYSPVVTEWEFYNEPDGANRYAAEHYYGSYWGHFPEEYTEMLCAIYPVVKAANPDARVVLGGIAFDSFENENGSFVREFLPDILRLGAGDCFDVMNFHYYPAFDKRWNTFGDGLLGKAIYLRTHELATYGVADKPLMVTEAGWHSNNYPGFPGTPDLQSGYVVKVFVQGMAADVESLIWWTWIDPPRPYGENGLLTMALSKKPAYYAAQYAALTLGQAQFMEVLNLDGDRRGYRFQSSAGRRLYVLWVWHDPTSSEGATGTYDVGLPLSRAQVTDMYGNPVMVVRDDDDGKHDGTVHVQIGVHPIYVEAIP